MMYTLGLFIFWIVLSQKFDWLHLLMGLVCAVVIGQVGHQLLRLPSRFSAPPLFPQQGVSWVKVLVYLCWLGWQIVLANIHIAAVVLSPRMPISPSVIRFKKELPHTLAQLVLANSITLTPGTITLDVSENEFVIHSLTETMAKQLIPEDGEGQLQSNVRQLFKDSVNA